jgi:hypothetical protein
MEKKPNPWVVIALQVLIDLFMFLAYANIWGVPHAHGL